MAKKTLGERATEYGSKEAQYIAGEIGEEEAAIYAEGAENGWLDGYRAAQRDAKAKKAAKKTAKKGTVRK